MRVTWSAAPTVASTGRTAVPNLAASLAWPHCLRYVDVLLPVVHLNKILFRRFSGDSLSRISPVIQIIHSCHYCNAQS